MFRTMLAAAAAVTLCAPAMAQDTSLLTGDPWECRAVSLIGEPTGELILNFGEGGAMYLAFYLELAVEDVQMAVEFDLSGTWFVEDATISIATTDFEMVGAWMDGEPMSEGDSEVLSESLAEQFANYGGQNEIAFISDHALVLEEPESSISCWR